MIPLTIYSPSGRAVRTAKNLRGILDYSRGTTVQRVDLFRPRPGRTDGLLGVLWADGAFTTARFESFTVMAQWVKARKCFAKADVRGLPA